MKLLNLAVLLIVVTITCSAQTVNDTILASQYYKKADSLLTERKLDSSIVYFKKALPIYEKAEAWERVAGCYNGISENQWRNRKLEISLQNAKKAIKISEKYLKKENQEEAYAYDNIGNYYENISDYDNAINYYQKALEVQQKIFPKIHPDIAKSYQNLGLINQYTFEFKSALQYYKNALIINEELFGFENKDVAWNYNNMGVVYRLLGKYNRALDCQKKSLAIRLKIYEKNHFSLAYNYINIGSIYSHLIQHKDALYYFKEAVPICIVNNDNLRLAYAYANIGTIHSFAGKYDVALKYFKKSLNIQLEVYKSKKHPIIAKTYRSVGRILERKNNIKESIEYYKNALSIYNVTLGENHNRVAITYMDIANSYTKNKEYDSAQHYYEKSLTINTTNLYRNDSNIILLYFFMSNLYKEKKEYKKALFYAQKSLKKSKIYYGEQHYLTLQSYNNVASIFSCLKKHKKAITYYNKAFMTNTRNNNHKHIKNTFNINEYYNHKLLLETLQGKAKTFQSLYIKHKNFKDLNRSITVYQKAEIVINNIRQSYQNYQDKISFAKQVKVIYSNAIKVQLLLYNEKQEQQILAKAFYYSEKSKSNTLKEFNNDTNAKNFAGLPSELLGLEKTFKINHAFYRSQILDEQSNTAIDSIKIKEFENKLFDISRRQDSLTEVLEKNYPKYHQLKYNNEVISVTDIQQKLNDNQTLLEFFTADSTTYAFTISKNELNVNELSIPKLQENIESLREHILSKNAKEFKTKSHQLYQQLIAPIKNQLVGNELIIVPDGPLWHLNFDLLLTQKDDSNDPKELSYLLKDYAITYANSATLLFNSFKTDKPIEKRQECLAFSFTDSTNIIETKTMDLTVLRGTDDDLPGTRKEIKAIADIIDGQYFYGSEANEKNFKKNASQYNILHLALHGDVDNERPENSKLYFTKSKDTLEDNLLYSHELFALDIPAELTVLSACNTGTGKIATGEGIMSLGNAFQYAGTKSLLLNSWEVDDQTAPTLMKYFYTNLKEGMNKAQALQKAKLQYLNTTTINRTDPFYWGGFYLVGDSAPIEFNDPNYWYWILGFGILAMILLSLFWYRRKTSS